jgi:hypothetical protein
MIDFPNRTLFNRKIPKQKFYEHVDMKHSLERQFAKEIETIYWRNKLSSDTLNISKGSYVTEIEIFEIVLKEPGISKNLIEIIDREIPYHLVFIVRYNDSGQIWISYKEDSKSREGKFKVDSYYTTNWVEFGTLTLEIEGLNLDKVYENFMLQVAGGKLRIDHGTDIKEAVSIAKQQDKLETTIKQLENKIRNEKQYNRQVHLMGELRKVNKQRDNYK